MELECRVRYERIDGTFHTSEWDNERGARKFFEGLRNEKIKYTIWAELIYASIDDDAPDEVIVVDDFERKVFEIMGHKVIGG